MANGALPFSLAKSKFYPRYAMLQAVATAGSGDEHIIGEIIVPSSYILNVNKEKVACVYDSSQTFYVTSSGVGEVFQIVPIAGNIDISIRTSIDGVNWDTPKGWSDVSGATASSTTRLIGLAVDEYIKIDITRNSGEYYINCLGGGN